MKKIPSLAEALAELEDFRHPQGKRYELISILLLACVAMMCGSRSQAAIADWGRNYGRVWLERCGIRRHRGPSQSTLHRIFKALDYVKLEGAIHRWAEAVLAAWPCPEGELEGLAVDGKTLRGSKQQAASDPHLLSVLSHRLEILVKQVAVSTKTNEIPATDELLQTLVLTGRVVTVDALLTQRSIAETILAQGGDYLMTVKDNQPTLKQDLVGLFESPLGSPLDLRLAQSVDLHGNRIEQRQLSVSTDLTGYTDWPNLAQVMRLDRTITHKQTGKITREVVYGVTSLPAQVASAQALLELWRHHWSIENKLHYVRDVTFDEDRSQVRTAYVPHVMAALRNTAISLLRLMGADNIAAVGRQLAARPKLAFVALGLYQRK